MVRPGRRTCAFPSELIPTCPHCGRPATTNLRADDKFVEDEGWHQPRRNDTSSSFAREGKQKILFLELGVGYNTPGIIKYPFWQMTAQNPQGDLCLPECRGGFAPEEIRARAICINGDIGEILNGMRI